MRQSEMETRTSTSPKSFKCLRAKSRMTIQSKSTPFSNKRKGIIIKKRSEIKSAGKISPGDQLRAELMLNKNHELLRSMRFNFRSDEKRAVEAGIETRGLEKILNTLRKPLNPNEIDKFKPFKPLFFSPKKAMERTLKEDQNLWIIKRMNFK